MKDRTLFLHIVKFVRRGVFFQKLISFFNYKNATVGMRSSVEDLPPLPLDMPICVRTLDMANSKDVAIWVGIICDAYDDIRSEKEGMKYIEDYPDTFHVRIEDTYVLIENGESIGTCSIGRLKRDEDIGAMYRFAIKKEFQGKGYGKMFMLYCMHQLKERGIETVEWRVSANRIASYFIGFGLGFRPRKYNSDKTLATKDWTFFPNRLIANAMLNKKYRQYLSRKR